MPRSTSLGSALLAASLALLPLGPEVQGAPEGTAAADTISLAGMPRTRPERTGYEETSRYADVVAFIDSLRLVRPGLDVRSFGYSEEGRALPLVVFGADGGRDPGSLRSDARLRFLVLANIHAGEVAGKEAALVLMRELASGSRDAWLDSVIVLVAPIYNADGNERIGLRNRPGQYGPLAGMGQRANARGLDLNRDNMKLDAAEGRALARLLRDFDPHVLVDLHTTNGTLHAYHLTYAPPLHPDTDPGIVDELRNAWLPWVTDAVRERSGWEFFHYGNIPGTWGMEGEMGWYTFDHRPRFTTNYVGLRNRFGILSEAYSYASFEERIRAHGLFVEALLDYASRHAGRLRSITRQADERVVVGAGIALSAELHRGDTITVLLGEAREEANPYSGERMRIRLEARRPERMPDYTSFRPSRTVAAPAGWLIPESERETIERLRAHGIRMRSLDAVVALEIEEFVADSVRISEREYQRRQPAALFGDWAPATRELPEGTVVVPADQPLGRLAALLLEPRSDDGLAAWSVLAIDEENRYPVLRARWIPD